MFLRSDSPTIASVLLPVSVFFFVVFYFLFGSLGLRTPIYLQDSKVRESLPRTLFLRFTIENLINDARLHLFPTKRYGVVGPSGCGKSQLLTSLVEYKFGIPEYFTVGALPQQVDDPSYLLSFFFF